jgi:hypothetical protein
MKQTSFLIEEFFTCWDITPCSPLKVNKHFYGTSRLQKALLVNCFTLVSRLQKALLVNCFTLVSCVAYSSTLKMEATRSPKRPLTFNGLHGVISQKGKLFITTAAKI